MNSVSEIIIRDSASRAAYIGSGEVSTDHRPREAGLGEVMQIGEIASQEWQTLWLGPYGRDLKEDAANSLVFHPFILRVPRGGKISAQLCVLICISSLIETKRRLYRGRTPLPLQLIVQRAANVPDDDDLRVYNPRSDFLLAMSTLPRLLVEVNSTGMGIDWPEDLIRMLLSGASIVRFTNKFLKPFREHKKFILVAIFIRNDGGASRYTMFQLEDNRSVCCTFCTSKLMG